jgi:hypothetical protein
VIRAAIEEGSGMDSCGKHPHEMGVALCRRCGDAWCRDCLVYAFGPKRPPFCMGCAMVAGGVRTASARPALSKRELKARMKAARREAKAGATDGTSPPSPPPPPPEESAPVAEPTPAETELEPVSTITEPGETDWSTPWWEDRQPTLAD